MKLYFERERISEFLGDDGAKLRFAQCYDVDVNFAKDFTQFFCSGIFQIVGGPPIIVLPWFLKGHIKILDGRISGTELEFFDLVKKIKYFVDSSVEIYGTSQNGLAYEIVCHSFLKKAELLILDIIQNNFFIEVEGDLLSIKGKWNVASDLRRGPRPLKFNCKYSSVSKDIKELSLLKGAVTFLSKRLRTKHNKIIIDKILMVLDEVADVPFTESTVKKIGFGVNAVTQHPSWDFIFQFIYNLFHKFTDKSADAGVSFKLPVDKFLEDLLFYLIRKVPGVKVDPQSRKDILGGSSWVSGDEIVQNTDVTKANTYSIPDLIVKTDDFYSIIECKYKPLRINFLNENSLENLSTFDRSDRNQLLSFALSIQPNAEMRNKRVTFNVVFPSIDVDSLKVSSLTFPFSKFSFNDYSKNIIQRNFKSNVIDQDVLKFNFIAINVAKALEFIRQGNALEFAKELVNQLTHRQIQVVESQVIVKTKTQAQIQKRVALASLIVKELPNDRTLGRTKMAKIVFLSDSMYKLDLGMQYARAAAGPLDYEAIVNKNTGIEHLAEKNAFFKTVRSKRADSEDDRFSYAPSVNLDEGNRIASNLFVETIEPIKALIKKLKPLNTEQSEIVATLFGCWNDLKFRGVDPSDDQIIDDFLNGWHENKERFAERIEVLVTWLNWMRQFDIIPVGDRILTLPKAA